MISEQGFVPKSLSRTSRLPFLLPSSLVLAMISPTAEEVFSLSSLPCGLSRRKHDPIASILDGHLELIILRLEIITL